MMIFEQKTTIHYSSPQVMVGTLGVHDESLRLLEHAFPDVSFRALGQELELEGPKETLITVKKLLEEMKSLVTQGHTLSIDTVQLLLTMVHTQSSMTPTEIMGSNILSSRGKNIRAHSANQKKYVDAIDDYTIVFGLGPAGTGKTYLAMAKAVQALQSKEVSRIILTRPAVEAGEKLGFLPGTLTEKIDPYLRPLYDALHDMLEPESIPRLMEAGTIEVAPLAYMRGRTLNDSFIILDEAQNTTAQQMKMFLTRLGFGSRIVVTGDTSQTDLPGTVNSGLVVVQKILKNVQEVYFAELTSADVVRHPLVGRIVDAYDAYTSDKQISKAKKLP